MSVLLADRTESKFEVIVFSTEIHDMLIELMQRSFGIKDLDQIVRSRYAHGKDKTENFSKYRFLMSGFKTRIEQYSALLMSNVRAANSIFPTSLSEYEKRREFQNNALVNCEQLINELQRIVDVFDVDINIYRRYINAIDREIGLIKKWRQKDNKFKSRFQG